MSTDKVDVRDKRPSSRIYIFKLHFPIKQRCITDRGNIDYVSYSWRLIVTVLQWTSVLSSFIFQICKFSHTLNFKRDVQMRMIKFKSSKITKLYLSIVIRNSFLWLWFEERLWRESIKAYFVECDSCYLNFAVLNGKLYKMWFIKKSCIYHLRPSIQEWTK